ncbi:MAG: cyclic nucleotide-binding domain-containing protein [Gammaproteobacteria bacterium]|nr:cyclic nucleotide-binding domain-containing protein [Gammaproteobacteria bacterium]MCP5299369.1 cyclic nucleotide-binding domain-containing protein [Chromatiaceae bacterium]
MSSDPSDPIVSARLIRESPLGTDLSDAQCRTLAAVASSICLDQGAMLLEEGHTDDALYIVVSGRLEVFRTAAGAEHVTLQNLHDGDLAGILGFIDGVPHSAAIRADGKCELISLSRADLEDLLATDPKLVFEVMRALIRAIHRIVGRMNAQFVEMSNYISHQHGRY